MIEYYEVGYVEMNKRNNLLYGPWVRWYNIEKKAEIDTIGGFIFFLIGRIPGRGEVINYKKILEFTVIEADTRRIKKILVTLKK